MKIEELMHALRSLSAHTFQWCDPGEQAAAESVAKGIAERANAEGLSVVVGTLIAAADMVERVLRVTGPEGTA